MHTTIFALLAVGAGACIALQAAANGNFRKNLDNTALFAAAFSILGTVLTATLAMALLRPQVPSAAPKRRPGVTGCSFRPISAK